MSGLNPDQLQAVNTLTGPLLVLAGAGTGKTRVITYRIVKLIATGTPRDRILAVTFTNKAANEMRERLMPMIKVKEKAPTSIDKFKPKYAKKQKFAEDDPQPTVSTFHSLCVKILRRRIDRLGYPLKFAIYSRGDQESLARTVLREISVNDKMLAPSQLLFHIGSWKCKSLKPGDAIMQSESDISAPRRGRLSELSTAAEDERRCRF